MNQDGTRTAQDQTATAEFRSALAKGTGRAVILLRKDPQNPELNAELLHACIKNLVYDPQCEEKRAPYLCELIQITGQQESYREALGSHLRAATAADSDRDIQQVFGILAQLAEQSDKRNAVLRDFVLTAGPPALAAEVAPDLIRLQGLGALLACFHRFGPDEDWWLIAEMTRALEERDGTEAARSAMQEARQADAALDRRLRLVEDKDGAPREPDAIPTYVALKAEVGAHRHFPRTWIVSASQKDLERAAADLVAETDEARVLAYLAIFRPRLFPGDPTRLFPLLASSNKRVAYSAASVLARVSHPAIRGLAHQMITDGKFGLGARLLRSNHDPGDLVLFKAVLDHLASDEVAYHDVGFSTLDLIESMAEKPEETRAVLLHLYEHGPCSNCRGRVVDQLTKMGGIPAWMAEEACYDAEPSIAMRFRPPVLQSQ